MSEKEIIAIVETYGAEGCTPSERYIDIGGQVYDGDKWICQVVYFNDERGLAAYWLDEFNNGYFIEYSKLLDTTKTRIETILSRLPSVRKP